MMQSACRQVAWIVLVAGCGAVAAPRFSVTPDRNRIARGETVTITATLVSPSDLGTPPAPQLPPSPDFTVVRSDRNQSSSTSVQIVNAQTTRTSTWTYVFTWIIAPRRAATFTFPAVSMKVGDDTLTANSFTIEVGETAVSNPDIRMSAVISKRRAWVGEQMVLAVTIAQKPSAAVRLTYEGFADLSRAVSESASEWFSVADISGGKPVQEQKVIDNEQYVTFTVRFALFALRPGKASFAPLTFTYGRLQQAQRRFNDPFESFFGGGFFGSGYQVQPAVLSASVPSVDIKPLPPAPTGFSGTVASCELRAQLSATQAATGEGITLQVVLSAQTRPGSLADPIPGAHPGFDLFDPERRTHIDTTASGLRTRRTLRYLLIPRREGRITFSPLVYTFFDPAAGRFDSVRTDPFELEIARGATPAPTRVLTQEAVREVGRDIRYIRTESTLRNRSSRPHREPHFWFLYILPFAVVSFAVAYRSARGRTPPGGGRGVEARARSAALRACDQLLRKGGGVSTEEFAARLGEVVTGYLSASYRFAATGLTLDELGDRIGACGVDASVCATLRAFLETIDSLRFSGGTTQARRNELVASTRELLGALHRAHRAQPKKTPRQRRSGAGAAAVLLLVALLPSGALGGGVREWFAAGNRCYANHDYDSAIVFYQKIIAQGVHNPDVHFNLGNAFLRLGQPGMAILQYEKARELEPADRDIEHNLTFATQSIVDRPPLQQRSLPVQIIETVHGMFSLRVQLWIGWALLLAASLCLSLSLFAGNNARLVLLYLLTVLVLLFSGVATSAVYKIARSEREQRGVVLDSSVDAVNEPGGNRVLFTLHEGTRFQVRSQHGDWVLVSLPDGVSGWVPRSALGFI